MKNRLAAIGIGVVIVLLAALLVINIIPNDTKALAEPQNNTSINATKTLSVNGTGKISIKPDMAIINVGVNTMDADAQKAQTDNAKAMEAVIKAVKNAGVKDEDIQTSNYSVEAQYDYSDNNNPKLTGYRVVNTVSVIVRKVDTAGSVLQAACNAGANQTYGISFGISDQDAAYKEALKKAIADAKSKAEVMATEVGKKVVGTLAVNESGSTPYPVYRGYGVKESAAMDSAVPVQTGQLEISASVSITYEIN